MRAGELSVRPDVVFTRVRVAVFLDGCFWHGCPVHGTSPRYNVAYWTDKLARNAARDDRVREALESSGWVVLRFWEHEREDDIVTAVSSAVRSAAADEKR